VVERVVAELVALLVQELQLLEAPLGLLPLDPLVAEERATGGRGGSMQNTALRGQSRFWSLNCSRIPTALVGSITSRPPRSR
jgi:hypothetical protein